ncbi:MAG: WYL domain-containing protein [Clostridia bacterium]|nr:WYL domain-containing protein [Clostridia bacterium]
METKSKILYLYKLLNEATDEEHPISTTGIIEQLGKIGISVTRKTVASDIDLLCEFGVDVVAIRSSQNMYYVGQRDFELPEVKLLIDAVESSKLITSKKSKSLVSKLTKLVSKGQARELNRHIFIDKRIKPCNEEVYYHIDKIHTAIESGKQIDFKYLDYNQYKEVTYKHNGLIYNFSPYALAWNDDHYYAIGYCTNHKGISKFRVDRMAKVELTYREIVSSPVDFNSADYVKSIFDMYDGDTVQVELKCTNDLMNIIIDRFGEDVETKKLDDNCFKVIAKVSVSPTFYGWVFQFADKISILNPIDVKNKYNNMRNPPLNICVKH